MKKTLIFLILCGCCFLSSCGDTSTSQDDPENLLFAWTEGYLASPVGEERAFALTFYCRASAPPLTLEDIRAAALDGLPSEDIGARFTWDKTDLAEEDDYIAYSLYCAYLPDTAGTFEAESVTLFLYDGRQLSCPFGHLTFDIGEEDAEAVDTWGSAVASSSRESFPYSYSPRQENTRLTRIQYAPDASLEGENGLDFEGKISLSGTYDAPIVLIMAKVWSDNGESEALSYGKGCYCGAVGASQSILQRSLAHWKTAS